MRKLCVGKNACELDIPDLLAEGTLSETACPNLVES